MYLSSLACREYSARINDGHSFATSQWLSAWRGKYHPPFFSRFIENKTVINILFRNMPGTELLKVGDVVMKIDGEDVPKRREYLRKYCLGSNDLATEKNIDDRLFFGNNREVDLTLERNGTVFKVTIPRYSFSLIKEQPENFLESWKMLSDNLDISLGSLEVSEVDEIFDKLKSTKAIIFDNRSYPNGTYEAICRHILPEKRAFANLTMVDNKCPGVSIG